MRILFHSLTLPYPATNGYKMRTWSLIQALAAEGHEITLVCFATAGEATEDTGELNRVCKSVEIVPRELSSLSSGPDVFGRLRALASPLPFGVCRFRCERMQRRLEGHIQQVDLIVTETSYSLINFPVSIGVPLILDNHNVEYVLLERYIERSDSPLRRAYARMECKKMKTWDGHACQRADLVLTCSENDSHLLRLLSAEAKCAVVPNTIDVSLYQADAGPVTSPKEPVILFTGGMDWLPNRDAALFFTEDVLPRIRQKVPNARFVVAGRNPSEQFRSEMSRFPGVELTGTVANMREIIATAAVCVVPLRIGSGTRLKILEAGAMGKAMVSTHLGAEGLDFEDGKEIVLADEAGQFSEEVIRLLSNHSQRELLGQAARHVVETKYGFTELRRSVRAALSTLPKSFGHDAKTKSNEIAWEQARS